MAAVDAPAAATATGSDPTVAAKDPSSSSSTDAGPLIHPRLIFGTASGSIGIISQIWVLPCLIALEILPRHFHGAAWSKWALTTLIIGYPYAHAVLVGMVSRNAGSVRTRTVGSSLYNMSVQVATIISSQIYRNDDKPYYYRGNKVLLGILAWNVVLFIGAKIYYTKVNERRDKIWNSWTREERLRYLATTKDEGNKRLNFRFAS